MAKSSSLTLTLACAISLSSASAMAKSGDYFLRPVFGISQLSDTSGQSQSLGQTDGVLDVNTESGINAGLGFGYYYSDNFAVEAFWEYRSNDSKTTIADGTLFNDGNYASNLIFVNGHYFHTLSESWRFYAGAGLGWVQEIDIDLEQNGIELSYSDSGSIAVQGFAGFEYLIKSQLSLGIEARYINVSSPELEGESNDGFINDLSYSPISLQIGLTWKF